MDSSSSKSESSSSSSKVVLGINAHPSPSITNLSTLSDTTFDDFGLDNLPSQIARLKLNHDASVEEIEKALMKCKELIFESDECSIERKLLVRYLVELRYRLEELNDVDNSLAREGISIMGHHMKLYVAPLPNAKLFCEQCSGTIWSVVQGAYICRDCKYLCHVKCVNNIYRFCAHVLASERGEFELNICPEEGLAAQKYECAECKSSIKIKDNMLKPRLCDYSGLYYCTTCHWNDEIEIPARIIHNWDWEKRPVCRASLQYLTITKDQLFINIEKSNPKLFNIVSELVAVKKVRSDLKLVHRYLSECKTGKDLITSEMVMLMEVPHLYSISMLEMIKNGILENRLIQMIETARLHISNCEVCSAKGYICEHCRKRPFLYPFDSGTVPCTKCNSLYHRSCFMKKFDNCNKCARLEKRAAERLKVSPSDVEDEDSSDSELENLHNIR